MSTVFRCRVSRSAAVFADIEIVFDLVDTTRTETIWDETEARNLRIRLMNNLGRLVNAPGFNVSVNGYKGRVGSRPITPGIIIKDRVEFVSLGEIFNDLVLTVKGKRTHIFEFERECAFLIAQDLMETGC